MIRGWWYMKCAILSVHDQRALVAGGDTAQGAVTLPDRYAPPRGKYIGEPLGDRPEDEADHFIRCPACDGWIDCRDLGSGARARRGFAASGAGSTAMRGDYERVARRSRVILRRGPERAISDMGDGVITELVRIHPIAPSHFDYPLSDCGTD